MIQEIHTHHPAEISVNENRLGGVKHDEDEFTTNDIEIAGFYDGYDNVSDISYSSRPNTAASSVIPLVMDSFIPLMATNSFSPQPETNVPATPLTTPTPTVSLPGWESDRYVACLADDDSGNNIEIEVFQLASSEVDKQMVPLKKSSTCTNRTGENLGSVTQLSRNRSVHPNAPKPTGVPNIPKQRRKSFKTLSITATDLTTRGKIASVPLVKTNSVHPKEPLISGGKTIKVPLQKTTSTPIENKKFGNKLEPKPLVKSRTGIYGIGLTKANGIPMTKEEIKNKIFEDRPPLYPTTEHPEFCTVQSVKESPDESALGNIEIVLNENCTDDDITEDEDDDYNPEEESRVEPEEQAHVKFEQESRAEPEEQIQTDIKTNVESDNVNHQPDLQPKAQSEPKSARKEHTKKEDRITEEVNELEDFILKTTSNGSMGSYNNCSIKTDTTQKRNNTSGLEPVEKLEKDVIYFPIRYPKKKKKKKNRITMSSGLRKGAEKKSVRTEDTKKSKETVLRYSTIRASRSKKKKESELSLKMW